MQERDNLKLKEGALVVESTKGTSNSKIILSQIDKEINSSKSRETVEDFELVQAVEHVNNKGYMFVGNKIYRVCKCPNWGTPKRVRVSKDDFLNTFADKKTFKGINYGKVWLESPLRRKYEDFCFRPGKGLEYDGYYNEFRGWKISPAKTDKSILCLGILEHIKECICDGNEKHNEYVLNWLAHIIQKPEELPGVALVLTGVEGAGKGTFVQVVMGLIGKELSWHITNSDRLTSNFNSQVANKILIYVDEAALSNKQSNILKGMISEESGDVEKKGFDTEKSRNYARIIIASNYDNPLKIEDTARRYLVLRVNPDNACNAEYFMKLKKQLNEGGYEELMKLLSERDISEFIPGRLPENEALFDMKMERAKSYTKFILEGLKPGADLIKWGQLEKKEEIYQNYRHWCIKEGVKTEANCGFFKGLKSIFPRLIQRRSSDADRAYLVQLPSLLEAREFFRSKYKAPVNFFEIE